MLTTRENNRLLTILLLIGGIPPVISGLAGMFAGMQYLDLIGENVLGLFSPTAEALLLFITNLWGGDAFVAGISRVIVAFLGNMRIKLWFGAVAIFHSIYSLWLLPARFLGWCVAPETTCNSISYLGAAFFLLLHVALVIGFSVSLYAALRRRW